MYYKVFGLICQSAIELPALLEVPYSEALEVDFSVTLVKDLPVFNQSPVVIKPFSQYNSQEFKYSVPEVAEYLVQNGNSILIKPLCEDWESILLFFNSNALAALLYQRNLIPFHVSGILDADGCAWLFAAHSRTGKSTTALKLKELGYRIFCDDTALIDIREKGCYAIPSYPLIRAWKNTLNNQAAYSLDDAYQIRVDVDKYGIPFHEEYFTDPVPLAGIVFLQIEGDSISIEQLSKAQGMQHLGNNIYRSQWINGMNKQLAQFKQLTGISAKTQFWMAKRPKDRNSFHEFAQEIADQILKSDEL
ncbi:hypothetical protein [Mongoliitalea lutea]|uniref:Hpr(Ser) kinase/phosphatase n=1 Tax=Mongoliitalea lutea TaxID=849756 RepID=A0A8J3G5H2_9BACT|nr:hypothetical protein [Mongoliitalea lutea]GHB37007.1 hypothetical protein GCM10008106_17860 [Mongoliitalea lutea]